MLARHKNEIKRHLKYFMPNSNDNEKNQLIEDIEKIIDDKFVKIINRFNGFNIGDKVMILEEKHPIISYDGKPEGFQPEDYGKIGIVKKFDVKTMSQKNIFVDINGKMVCGHHSKLKKV